MSASTTVLIVDDDPDIRDMEAEILSREGYVVRIAENGRVALEMLASCEAPCLVLLNVVMPEMSGTELLDALRRSGRLTTLPVVVVSATFNDVGRADGVRVVRKPLSADVLLRLVAEFCNLSGPRD